VLSEILSLNSRIIKLSIYQYNQKLVPVTCMKDISNTSEDSNCESREDAYAHEGELLMIRRTLNNQPSP